MLDVLICTNPINLTVALNGARPGRDRPALLLHERWRFGAPKLARVVRVPIGMWTWRMLRVLVALGRVHTLYLPHDRFNWRVRWCRDRVRRVVYLDDGLDTHRHVPMNFDLDSSLPARYLTFDDFVRLPSWLSRFELARAGPLANLADTASLPTLPIDGASHVFVESPGLDVAAVIDALRLPDDQVLVVRHPVPSKRIELDRRWRQVEGAQHGVESTLLTTQRLQWYFGETMALLFAVHAAGRRGHALHAQLSDAQRDNLVGLRLSPDERMAGLYRVA